MAWGELQELVGNSLPFQPVTGLYKQLTPIVTFVTIASNPDLIASLRAISIEDPS
jgi:hypothetical protein